MQSTDDIMCSLINKTVPFRNSVDFCSHDLQSLADFFTLFYLMYRTLRVVNIKPVYECLKCDGNNMCTFTDR